MRIRQPFSLLLHREIIRFSLLFRGKWAVRWNYSAGCFREFEMRRAMLKNIAENRRFRPSASRNSGRIKKTDNKFLELHKYDLYPTDPRICRIYRERANRLRFEMRRWIFMEILRKSRGRINPSGVNRLVFRRDNIVVGLAAVGLRITYPIIYQRRKLYIGEII